MIFKLENREDGLFGDVKTGEAKRDRRQRTIIKKIAKEAVGLNFFTLSSFIKSETDDFEKLELKNRYIKKVGDYYLFEMKYFKFLWKNRLTFQNAIKYNADREEALKVFVGRWIWDLMGIVGTEWDKKELRGFYKCNNAYLQDLRAVNLNGTGESVSEFYALWNLISEKIILEEKNEQNDGND